MKIAVLVKQVPDTWGERTLDLDTGRIDRQEEPVIDEITERAVEAALRRKDADGSEVVVVTMGPDKAQDTLRKALSMGADSAVHIVDERLAGSDLSWTAQLLSAALTRVNPDLVITGNESTDGRGGVLPAMLAELLGRPLLDGLDELTVSGGTVTGVRVTDSGVADVHAALPAVVSITERIAEPRFASFTGIMSAKKKPLEKLSADDLGGVPATAESTVLTTAERPARDAGRKVVDDGTAAAQLADFLRERRLV